MNERDLDARISVVGSLADPIRRALYRFVVLEGGGIGRDEAAEAVGVSRALAAYHLDRLVDEGVLVAGYERRGERRGPGQGRPAKVYDRAAAEVQVSLPPRDYEVAARLFAQAFEDSTAEPRVALAHAARTLGAELGAEAAHRAGKRASTARRRKCMLDVLRERGYEPFDDSGTIRLRNCPFDALATEHRDLVCNMNFDVIAAMVSALDVGLDVALAPREGHCCVAMRSSVPGPKRP